MPDATVKVMHHLDADSLSRLIELLAARGYRTVGPVLRDGAIVYDAISSAADLPRGRTERQVPGGYRVVPREDDAWFGFAVGPHTWKKFLYPAEQTLWRAARGRNGFAILPDAAEPDRLAIVGIRPCDLAGLDRLDQVLLRGPFADSDYAARRAAAFLVAIQCAEPADSCFCASMGTGPRAERGFDLALTEILEGTRHYFTCEAGSEAGREVAAALGLPEAPEEERTASSRVSDRAAGRLRRSLDTAGLKERLQESPEHPHWDEVAGRCLACGSCTLVCPTCFCATVEDRTDLTGDHAERIRRWDSCFNGEFSYIHGGQVRGSGRSRYRQWLTHKLAHWVDQFGACGCVGCGRCITWCPAGIDITEEAKAIRRNPGSIRPPGGENAHENP